MAFYQNRLDYPEKQSGLTMCAWSAIWVCLAVLWTSGSSWAAIMIELEPIATNLDQPVAITHAGDSSGRLFITLKGGQIVIYDGSDVVATPFLDISALVSNASEQGLLSVAFHPDYAANGFFFVDYTNTNGDTVIARYSVSADADRADPGSAQILLTIAQPFQNHNGGQLQFGPDGYLYIGMGDGGSGGDPQDNGQNLGTLLGKILRIDVDGGTPYAVPADNPFIGNPTAQPEIWALGLRNPWRFSFDRITGDMFIADVGQSSWEEVDFQTAASPGGENYGWRRMEGTHCFNPASNCNDGTLTLPILEYSHSFGCSITGGYRYRGARYPDLEGVYFYADYCSGRIWGAHEDQGGVWVTEELMATNLQITTFGEDEDGEVYLAHFASPDGAVYRITTTSSTGPSSSGGGGGGGSCFIGSAANAGFWESK
jgi:glucose/arabinose dehydrogenase